MLQKKEKRKKREARFANTQFIDSFISAQSNSVTVCQPQSKLARNTFMRYGREYTLSTKRGEANRMYATNTWHFMRKLLAALTSRGHCEHQRPRINSTRIFHALVRSTEHLRGGTCAHKGTANSVLVLISGYNRARGLINCPPWLDPVQYRTGHVPQTWNWFQFFCPLFLFFSPSHFFFFLTLGS